MNSAYLLLLILIFSLVFPLELAAKSGPLVIAVDGLSLNEIGPDFFEPGQVLEKYTNLKSGKPGYLGDNLENSTKFKSMDAEIKKYTWGMPNIQDRDPQFTRQAINDLKKNILQTYEVAKNDNRPLVIVSHSWGTVIAQTALTELAEAERKHEKLYGYDPKVRVDSLITMGSPLEIKGSHGNNLDEKTVRKGISNFVNYEKKTNDISSKVEKPSNVKYWENYWAAGDRFSDSVKSADKNVQLDRGFEPGKSNAFDIVSETGVWHKAYYDSNLRTNEIINQASKDITQQKSNWDGYVPSKDGLKKNKDQIASIGSNKSTEQANSAESGGKRSGYKTKELDAYEKMDRKDLRKELEQKLGYKLNDDYDKKSKRELISELTGVPKEQIHASGNDPKKPDKQTEPKGKSLDQYERMSKGDLRKELEKKTGEQGKYDKLSSRELISALTGTPKDQIHGSANDPKKPDKQAEPKGKSLDQYENLSKKELRKELEKKTGKSDKFDKMSKRELVSALTGIPKDKIDLDKKEKDQTKKKDDDRQKKDGGAVTKLSKAQAEEIWKARPDVDKSAHDKKAGDPYKQTQKWWDKYGQKEMGNYQFAGTTPAAAPPATAASPAPAPSTPAPSQIKKLSKAQMEEVWKARPDVNENVHAKKKGDPFEKTQTWWENYGRKEMGNYQFAGTTPAATPPATAASPAPAPSTPTPSPIKKLSKAQAEEIWKARPDVNENVHAKKKGDPYEKTQTWWDKYGRKEMPTYQFAGTSPPRTDTPGPPITSAPAPSPPVVSTPGPIPSAPSPGSVAAQPPSPVPSSSSPSKLGGSAKVIVGGKELQDGKYVMDNGYWQIKNGKIVSSGPLVDMRGKPIVDIKDATKLGPNDKLIIDGHETKHGYRTLVAPVKGPKGQQPGEEGLRQREEKPRQEDHKIIKEALRPRPQELPTRAQEEGQRQAEKDRQHRAQLEEKRRKQEEGRAEQERQKQAKLEEQRRRGEANRFQEAKRREEQAKAGERLKAQQEERKRQEAQRGVEQERQRQAKANEQRRREEQQRQAKEQAQQRHAQMEQQRRADEQRQRAQQEQLRRQQEQQQRSQIEQQRRMQAEQQQRLQLEQQRRQHEEAMRHQAQMQQQRQMQQQQRIQPPPPPPRQQQQPQPQKQKKQQQQ